MKNLRPITLLEVIWKILSKIFMDRAEKINKHLSQWQSAYIKCRSTTNLVLARSWVAAKTQVPDIVIFNRALQQKKDKMQKNQ